MFYTEILTWKVELWFLVDFLNDLSKKLDAGKTPFAIVVLQGL